MDSTDEKLIADTETGPPRCRDFDEDCDEAEDKVWCYLYDPAKGYLPVPSQAHPLQGALNMDMSMRERIARALAERAGRYQEDWQLHVGDADAVLDAMMEPDEGMLRAGWNETQCDWFGGAEDLRPVFTAMITAARSGA